jgi:hypothetical protein
LELVNHASERISRVSVTVSQQIVTFVNGQAQRRTFKVAGDSGYDVTVTFESGKTLGGTDGYVTDGVQFHDQIIITDTAISVAWRVPPTGSRY